MEHCRRKGFELWKQEDAHMLLLGKILALTLDLLRSFLICTKQIYYSVNLVEVIGHRNCLWTQINKDIWVYIFSIIITLLIALLYLVLLEDNISLWSDMTRFNLGFSSFYQISFCADNLAANFSRELADYIIYIIDVSAGDKIPRKGGPGITQADLLVCFSCCTFDL